MSDGDRAETIFALSSGRPPAAIAIVRISGPQAGETVEALAGRLPVPRVASLRSLRDADGLLDRALILWFPGPDSATGEDLAELHLHGGRAVVDAVLRVLGKRTGLRAADPGEFTRRTFFNGRIDLSQAEGLADLLEAETEQQRRHALAVAEGGLAGEFEAYRIALLDIAARIEAQIDYADEDDIPIEDRALRDDIAALADRIADRLTWPGSDRLRDGVTVVIAGPPNAGKSSLLNALAKRDAALVSDVPGTTRDLIDVPLKLGGIPFLLTDSAGLRGDEADMVERMGIARAEQSIGRADIVLWLGDPAMPPPQAEGRILRLLPKADLSIDSDMLPAGFDLAVSSWTGAGIPALAAALIEHARPLLPRAGQLGLDWRHRDLLEQVLAELHSAFRTNDLLIMANHVGVALAAVDRLVGRSGVEEMLDRLFARFCIGK